MITDKQGTCLVDRGQRDITLIANLEISFLVRVWIKGNNSSYILNFTEIITLNTSIIFLF